MATDGTELSSGSNIRTVVVDDHTMFAQSLASALDAADDIEVVGLAHDGTTAVALVRRLQPDVVLLDSRLPGLAGSDAIRAVLDACATVRVVVITAAADEHTVVDALEAGCVGYLTKDQDIEEVHRAVRSVHAGKPVIPPNLLPVVMARVRTGRRPSASALTAREREVLIAIATGKSNRQVARELYVSENTIRNHVANVLAKLGAHSKLEAVSIATRQGLLPPSHG